MTFDVAPLKDLLGEKGYIRGPFGSSLKRGELKEEGIPVYEQQHAISGTREFRFFIDDEKYQQLKRFTVKNNDLIISCSGTVGRISVIEETDPKGIISQALLILRPDAEKILPQYLYYFFTSKQGLDELINASQGAVQLNIAPRAVVEKIPVPLPSIDKQKDIVGVLKSIDDKIELNRQTNQCLEQIAQAMFKSWFVDFEPVKAKIRAKAFLTPTLSQKEREEVVARAAMCAISGKSEAELDSLKTLPSPAGRGAGGEGKGKDNEKEKPTPRTAYDDLAATAALFPDELEDSELGEIPKGWRESNIGNEFIVTMGQSPPGKTYNENGEGMPFFQGRRDFGWRYPSNRVYCSEPKRLAKEGDTLLSVRAPVGDVNKATADCCTGRGIAAIRHKSGCEAYTFYSMQRLKNHFDNFDSEGTVFGSINQRDLKAIGIVKPPNRVFETFSVIAGTLDHQIKILDKQVNSLTSIRDTLLPKLLSGEISLGDTPSIAEAVA